MTKEEEKLTTRMYNGDYIVRGTGGFFWANSNHPGCLIEAVDYEDIVLVQKLANSTNRSLGIRCETKIIRIQ